MLRTMLFLLMGAGLLGFSFVAWVAMHPPQAAAPPIPKVTVLAAASTLRAGTLLKPDDIEARARTRRRPVPNCSAPWCARHCCNIRRFFRLT
jgi:Flp pilus assembly protein CpaB